MVRQGYSSRMPKRHEAAPPKRFGQRYGVEFVYGGWREFDAWKMSPLMEVDLVFFEPTAHFEADLMDVASPEWEVTMPTRRRVRVEGATGKHLREKVEDYLERAGISYRGLIVCEGVWRRNPATLPVDFIEHLIARHTRDVWTRIGRKYRSKALPYMDSVEDLQSEISVFMMEAVSRFDATKGAPFRKWVNRIGVWNTLSIPRANVGRPMAAALARWPGMVEEYVNRYGHLPTQDDLAPLLGDTVDQTAQRSKDMDRLLALNSPSPINDDLPVVSEDLSPEESAEREELRSAVSRALLSASREDSWTEHDPEAVTAFLMTYLRHYSTWTAGDLALLSPYSPHRLTANQREFEEALSRRLGELAREHGYGHTEPM